MTSRNTHDRMANAIRALAMDAVEAAKSGHPGMPMGMADVATVLFTRFLKYDPRDVAWPDRDRFVLSAGHGSMLLYSLLHLIGVDSVPMSEIRRFRQLGSHTPGHPESFATRGIETTTGPLGQGLGNAVGMALAERLLNARFGDAIVDHRTYAIASDGDLMEGISQEAITLAGHLGLSRLTVMWDDNHISIDGALSLSDSTDQLARFKSAGWNASRIDGRDPEAIAAALEAARTSDRPTLIACRTTIGYGAPTKAGTSSAHGSPLGAAEIEGTRKALGWDTPPFEIPADVLEAWRTAGRRSEGEHTAWTQRLAAAAPELRAEFERRVRGDIPAALGEKLAALKADLLAKPQEVATRRASEIALEVVAEAVPELISGSADLTGSNNTKVKATPEIGPGSFAGRFVHWGIREHGMVAAMSGMALHRGVLPASGTFLVFSDYCRPAIRLAAMMGVRAVYVMTHDSIGVGEDGPTHQPVEHLAALRAIPNLKVFRPADTIETAECWELAVTAEGWPSLLALTRQNLPQLRTDIGENRSARGAYELAPASGAARVSLFATGSEVSLAVEAKGLLDAAGIPTRVVSVPCMELFFQQDAGYRAEVIGSTPVRIGIEAAIRQGWDAIIGSDGGFVGMHSFGASGPYKAVYEHFGITAQAVAALARERL